MKLLFVLSALMISASAFAGSISLNGGRISDGAGNGGRTMGSCEPKRGGSCEPHFGNGAGNSGRTLGGCEPHGKSC